MTRGNVTASGASEPDPRWLELSWDDLEAWAGSRSVERGRAYHRQGRVQDLAISPEHRLLATVSGGRRYTTTVWFRSPDDDADESIDSPLRSTCTCPVGDDGCKHAVAVLVRTWRPWKRSCPFPSPT